MKTGTMCMVVMCLPLLLQAQAPNGSDQSLTDFRSDSIDVLHTDLSLDMRQTIAQTISGACSIALRAHHEGVNSILFDFQSLTVDSILGPVSSFSAAANQLKVQLSQLLSITDTSWITVYYHGTPAADSSGWGGFYFNGAYAWNLGVGFDADPHSFGRAWFPCFDNFIERSSFHFRVRTNAGQRAACNGLLLSESQLADGSLVFTWHQPEPIPSYLACVAVANYQVVSQSVPTNSGNVLVQNHAAVADTANMAASFVHLPDAVNSFCDHFGPYRFSKVGYSLVPFGSGAMEHATNITYPIYAANGGLANEDLMAHELAHMWWGNNVTCRHDTDMWINEGWASFGAYLFSESVYGRQRYEDDVATDLLYMLQFGHQEEGGYRAVSGQPHEYVYGDHVYKKGALMAHNLRGLMGDEDFFDACADFMETHSLSPVSSRQLRDAFQTHTTANLDAFFRDWIFTGGYTVVVLDSFSTEPTTGGYQCTLYVRQKLKGRTEWHSSVPVYVTPYAGFTPLATQQFTLEAPSGSFTFQTSEQPTYLALYDAIEQAQARTRDKLLIKAAGSHNLKNMLWNVQVSTVSDSAIAFMEHIWAAPSASKPFGQQPYKLSTYHYWKVSGIGLEGVSMSATFNYDGRTTSGNSAYLDMDLVSVQEDSLVLLYRPSAGDEWAEYEHYTKNVLGSSVNAFGVMQLSQVLAGEYTLANVDHSVLSASEINEWSARVFPNPNLGELNVQMSDALSLPAQFVLINHAGVAVLADTLHRSNSVLRANNLPNGVYTYSIAPSVGEVASGKVVISR